LPSLYKQKEGRKVNSKGLSRKEYGPRRAMSVWGGGRVKGRKVVTLLFQRERRLWGVGEKGPKGRLPGSQTRPQGV